MIEHDQRYALLLELGAEALCGAAAQVERGIGAGTPDDLAQRRGQPGGSGQRIQLVQAVRVEALAVGGNRKQCDLGVDDTAGEFVAGRIRFQLSGLSWWKSTARAGTTVEMACL
jgi:hypothetical protein